MSRPATPEHALLRALYFTGRVQFTMLLLLLGILFMVLGTMIESSEGREAAQAAIYQASWFQFWLGAVAWNLLLSVLLRLPLKRAQYPFVIVHASLVLLLIGVSISHWYGFEGRVQIPEASRSNQLALETQALRARWTGPEANEPTERAFRLSAANIQAPMDLQDSSPDRPSIRLTEWVPDGVVSVDLEDAGAAGSPGIGFEISGLGVQTKSWLISDHRDFRRRSLGALEVEVLAFRDQAILDKRKEARSLGKSAKALVTIEVQQDRSPVQIRLPMQLEESVPLGGALRCTARQFLQRAQIVGGKIRDVSQGMSNPAVVLEVTDGKSTEKHIVFSNFPQFNVVEGRGKTPLIHKAVLEAVEAEGKPLVSFLIGPKRNLFVQASTSTERGPAHPCIVGREIGIGEKGKPWLTTRVQRFVESARPVVRVQPSPEGQRTGRSYFRIEGRFGAEMDSVWLGQGNSDRLILEGGVLDLHYGRLTKELPFSIELVQFEELSHMGSSRPMDYKSHVRLHPSDGSSVVSATVSMNHPVDFAGFRIFQFGVSRGPKGQATTTLSVSYDPGVTIVYIAFVLLIVGVILYLRKRKPKHAGVAAATLLLSLGLSGNVAAQGERVRMPVEATRGWAIQIDGRVKPLETHARETLRSVTGKDSLLGGSALELLWTWNLGSEALRKEAFFRFDSKELKSYIGVLESQKRYSYDELQGNERFHKLAEQALTRKQAGKELSRLENDALLLLSQKRRIERWIDGTGLHLVPKLQKDGAWASPASFSPNGPERERAIFLGFAAMHAAWQKGDVAGFRSAAETLGPRLRSFDSGLYPSEESIDRELLYEDLRPFSWAWKLYLVGFLLIAFFGFRGRLPFRIGAGAICAGLLLHGYGIALRWIIAGRAPVSDMYESLIFMGLGVVAIGMVFELVGKRRYFAMTAGMMGFLALLLAEDLPIDSAINPLVPMLAHTNWLAIHVMTIMLSYSAMALAMGLGHVTLAIQLFRPGKTELLTSLSRLLYKTMQVGIAFLAAGIVFGAIWANESWGRYWGWDPKETWSLITFFVYLAVVHARFAGWLQHFGLAVSSIGAFLAVVMTYYGVNFVLGSGLHAYGQSSGGRLYALGYVIFEALVIGLAALRYRNAEKLKLEMEA